MCIYVWITTDLFQPHSIINPIASSRLLLRVVFVFQQEGARRMNNSLHADMQIDEIFEERQCSDVCMDKDFIQPQNINPITCFSLSALYLQEGVLFFEGESGHRMHYVRRKLIRIRCRSINEIF